MISRTPSAPPRLPLQHPGTGGGGGRVRGRGGGGAHQVAGVLVQGRQLGGLCRQVISFLIVVEESYVKYLIMRTYLF